MDLTLKECDGQTDSIADAKLLRLTSDSEGSGSNSKPWEWVLRVLAKIPYTCTTNLRALMSTSWICWAYL